MANRDDLILTEAARILDSLGPFPEGTRRSAKWRTADQLAAALSATLGNRVDADEVEEVLLREHKQAVLAADADQIPAASIRRAYRPDLTTARRLWGSTKHLGQVEKGFPREERQDSPVGARRPPRSGPDAPRLFLCHRHVDLELAKALAEELARNGIDIWMAEFDIEGGASIVDHVGDALNETDALVALVTARMLESLWCRTELHTQLTSGYPSYLVIDTSDKALMGLLSTMTVTCGVGGAEGSFEAARLEQVGERMLNKHQIGDLAEYVERARGFAHHMLDYLGGHPAVGYPSCPEGWEGPIQLMPLSRFVAELKSSFPADVATAPS